MKSLNLQITSLVILLAGSGAQAFPPRTHSERGTVSAVDAKNHTLTLQICCEEQQFVWHDWTRIRIDGRKVKPENVVAGKAVRVSFRHELGQRALYEVRSTVEPATPCCASMK